MTVFHDSLLGDDRQHADTVPKAVRGVWSDQEPSLPQRVDGTFVYTIKVLRDWHGFPKPSAGKMINAQRGCVRSLENGHTWKTEDQVLRIQSVTKYTKRPSLATVVLRCEDQPLASYETDALSRTARSVHHFRNRNVLI